MYVIKEQNCKNTAPWEVPIEYRIKRLNTSKKTNVVYLYEKADTSTFRYRVYNICETTKFSKLFNGVYFFDNELSILEKYIDRIDILILSRYRWSHKLERFVQFVKDRGVTVSFEVDDMVYSTKYISKIMSTLSVVDNEDRYDYWFSYIGRLSKTLELCDCAITTNQYLAKYINGDTGKKTFIIPNTYNYFQKKVSDDYIEQKKNSKSEEPFVIGYFSGTPSHINDFLSIAPEVLRFIDEKKNVILRIVGFMDFPEMFRTYLETGKIEFYPLTDFVSLQKLISEVDVNIVPLVNNEFSSCKSELKFFEASIVGTITLATPSYTYSKAIKDGENGYLCQFGEWYNKLNEIYDIRGTEKYKHVLKNAYEYCERNYEYSNVVGVVDDVFSMIKEIN